MAENLGIPARLTTNNVFVPCWCCGSVIRFDLLGGEEYESGRSYVCRGCSRMSKYEPMPRGEGECAAFAGDGWANGPQDPAFSEELLARWADL